MNGGEGVSNMENSTRAKLFSSQFVPRKSFGREKEEHLNAKPYLDFLAHYDVELVQTDGPVTIVGCRTGTELPLEPKGKLQMLTLLLREFGTLDRANKAIQNHKTSHS
jgi:hypothetical protein